MSSQGCTCRPAPLADRRERSELLELAHAYQVESKIDAIVEFDMARAIPLAQ